MNSSYRYLTPETHDALELLRSWLDERSAIIKRNCAAATEKLGVEINSYAAGLKNSPVGFPFPKRPSEDWTNRHCNAGHYRPKMSTKGGKELIAWMKTLEAIPTPASHLGIEQKDRFFRPVQIIGHYPTGPTCLLVIEDAGDIPEGFVEITKKQWDLILAQYEVDQERAEPVTNEEPAE